MGYRHWQHVAVVIALITTAAGAAYTHGIKSSMLDGHEERLRLLERDARETRYTISRMDRNLVRMGQKLNIPVETVDKLPED